MVELQFPRLRRGDLEEFAAIARAVDDDPAVIVLPGVYRSAYGDALAIGRKGDFRVDRIELVRKSSLESQQPGPRGRFHERDG